ncbi:UDP-N-acetylmuramoyl-L-alanine--D-glutamate ligase [Reichenbachiella sp. MALMAid0571]|uniref:UDP-N-acetylmuramoyl-L-alanine--D-glutamate ligase n=1 Tax=Reichenbachiella sp. MALMAid0571 TaxID=3143939 RepID=UPI0032DF7C48
MKDKKHDSVAILGSGESGMGAALLANAKGLSVFLSDSGAIDDNKKQRLTENNIPFEENGHSIDELLKYDEIIKSPGIPEKVAVIKALRAADKYIISEIEFASRYTNAKLVAITGSNGKTTTTLLTYHLLKSAGLNVGMAGNIGNSLASLILEADYDIIVLELSSFQLDGMYEFKADTSLLLNITPDHLDRYNYDINQYADSKLRITQNQEANEQFIFNIDDKLIEEKMANTDIGTQKTGFSLRSVIGSGACQMGRKLSFHTEKMDFSIPIREIPLIGKHNLYNTMAAVLVAIKYGVKKSQILAGLKSFKNAPHRLEYVGTIDGVTFINDSKATNVDSVYYALEGMDRNVIWIAGGVNKGNDYSVLKDLVNEKVSALVCLGTDNKHLLDAFCDDIEIIHVTHNMSECIDTALKIANPGDVVLLSPACASFDLFNNYEHRGDEFKRVVLDLKKKFKSVKTLVI